jgi:hypothetical protein
MDNDYCSDYCETAGEQPDSVCLCGHPECHLMHTAPQMCQLRDRSEVSADRLRLD